MTGPATFDPGFSTPAMEEIFNASGRVSRMLQVESALAAAQGDLGLIPATAAADIAVACGRVFDSERILAEGWEAGTPVIPLLAEIRRVLPADAVEWLHHRATTQDIVDSAAMIQTRAALGLIVADVNRVIRAFEALVERCGDLPMMARTLMQPALPTTLRQRATSLWIAPLGRGVTELTRRASALPLQLGGPIGDGAGLTPDLLASVARRLGLVAPASSWHSDRSPISSVVNTVERTVAAAAKVAHDLILLSQPEIGEISMRAGGSSAMAHKRNPTDAIRCLAAADACSGVASTITRARPHELERAAGSWHAEWFALPAVFHTAGASLASLVAAATSATVSSSAPS